MSAARSTFGAPYQSRNNAASIITPRESGQRNFSPLQNSVRKSQPNMGMSTFLPTDASGRAKTQNSFDSVLMQSSVYSTFELPDVEREMYVQYLPKKWDEKLVEWQNADHCYLCQVVFSKITLSDAKKRTHCRKCGYSVCRLCCANEIQLCQINPKKEKVCNKCCAEVQNLHIRQLYRHILDKGKATLQFLKDLKVDK